MNLLLIAIGGALGSVARYLFSSFVLRATGSLLPIGTFAVNLLGLRLLSRKSSLLFENTFLGVAQEESILPSGSTFQRISTVILNLAFLAGTGTPALKNFRRNPTACVDHLAGLVFSLLPLT